MDTSSSGNYADEIGKVGYPFRIPSLGPSSDFSLSPEHRITGISQSLLLQHCLRARCKLLCVRSKHGALKTRCAQITVRSQIVPPPPIELFPFKRQEKSFPPHSPLYCFQYLASSDESPVGFCLRTQMASESQRDLEEISIQRRIQFGFDSQLLFPDRLLAPQWISAKPFAAERRSFDKLKRCQNKITGDEALVFIAHSVLPAIE